MKDDEPAPQGDLSVTALYTAGVWAWAGFPAADLFASPDTERVFGATNAALSLGGLFKRGTKSLKHSLAHRHAMIDHIARTSGATTILELAAGLSCRGAALSSDSGLRYVEVDREHVIAQKLKLLERTEAGRRVLARQNLIFQTGDVLTTELDDDASLVIAEGLLMYLEPDQQRGLFAKLRKLLGNKGGELVFDLVPACEQPKPGAVGGALGWMMKRFTGGKTFARDERTRADLIRELEEAGYHDVEAIEPGDVAAAWGLPFPDADTQQLVFRARAKRD